MRDLGLDGVSDDRRYVLLRSDDGEAFRVVVDERLRAASRGDRARLGQVEISMDSALRPREIQSRVRAGESPEAVAAVAQMSVDRVMAYAGPVLAEREHVCSLARRSALRRRHASGPGRLLGETVDEHLRGRGLDPSGAGWDSWRRDDGRWAVTVAGSRSGEPATFLFDPPGRYAVAHDDAARQLVGDQPPLEVEPESEERAEPTAFAPHAVPEPEAAATPEATTESVAETEQQPRARALSRLRRTRTADTPGEQLIFDATPEPMADTPPLAPVLPAHSAGDEMDALARAVGGHPPDSPASDAPAPDVVADDSETGRQRRRKDRRRASVPSWDEIMFGSRPQR